MNVEMGTEAAQFPEKKYINGTCVAVYVHKPYTTITQLTLRRVKQQVWAYSWKISLIVPLHNLHSCMGLSYASRTARLGVKMRVNVRQRKLQSSLKCSWRKGLKMPNFNSSYQLRVAPERIKEECRKCRPCTVHFKVDWVYVDSLLDCLCRGGWHLAHNFRRDARVPASTTPHTPPRSYSHWARSHPHYRLNFIHYRLNFIHTRLDLIPIG